MSRGPSIAAAAGLALAAPLITSAQVVSRPATILVETETFRVRPATILVETETFQTRAPTILVDSWPVAPRVPTVFKPCQADWNGDGVPNSTDVSDFINDWFTDLANGTLVTDYDANGTVNSTDVSSFINAYFEGC